MKHTLKYTAYVIKLERQKNAGQQTPLRHTENSGKPPLPSQREGTDKICQYVLPIGVRKQFSHVPIRDGRQEGSKPGVASNVAVCTAFKNHVQFILCLTTSAARANTVSSGPFVGPLVKSTLIHSDFCTTESETHEFFMFACRNVDAFNERVEESCVILCKPTCVCTVLYPNIRTCTGVGMSVDESLKNVALHFVNHPVHIKLKLANFVS